MGAGLLGEPVPPRGPEVTSGSLVGPVGIVLDSVAAFT